MDKAFKDSVVVFKTGGTTSRHKEVKKTRENMERESRDIAKELGLEGDLLFMTTTPESHLFGFSFHYILPKVCGFRRSDNRVNYPEDINAENVVLITTPSFLEALRKFDAQPEVNPKIIITAGSALEHKTFEYAMSISQRVIEIYGSTETGVIAYRTSPDTKVMKLFSGIKVLEANENYTKFSTEYSAENTVVLDDRIKIIDENHIEFCCRCGRVLKIQEKRVLSDEMEGFIKECKGIEDAYCFEFQGKLAALVIPNEYGKEFLLKNGKLTYVKDLKHKISKKSEIVPQKWKFYDEIPRKDNGKINKDEIENIFNFNSSLPLILAKEITPEYAKYKLSFIKNSSFFKGHF